MSSFGTTTFETTTRLGLTSARRFILFAACLIIALAAVTFVPAFAALEPAPNRALFILILAALLWVTEAIEAFAVGILIIGLDIALLGDPNAGVFATTRGDYTQFIGIIGSPLIWLFFGGFVLAAGMNVARIDRWIAGKLVGALGTRPPAVLFGVMAATFVLSMFMSNTATTAMMIATVSPLLRAFDKKFATGLVLGTAVAANLGGMGTLIGTPANAIAVGVLATTPAAVDVSFSEWLLIGFPIATVLALFSWGLLSVLFKAESKRLPPVDFAAAPGESPIAPWKVVVVAATFLVTVSLWMTSELHGMPTAVVSLIPIVLLTATGVLTASDIRGLNYDVLFLMAGGLALGHTVTATGLADWIVASIPTDSMGIAAIAIVFSLVTVAMSNFMSNTAAANIVLPLSVTIAVGFEAAIAIPVALAASAAMCLPIATPPNAMAFATGHCKARDFMPIGLILGTITPIVGYAWVAWMLGILDIGG